MLHTNGLKKKYSYNWSLGQDLLNSVQNIVKKKYNIIGIVKKTSKDIKKVHD